MRIDAQKIAAAAVLGCAACSAAVAGTISVEASSAGSLVLTSTDTSAAGSQVSPWTLAETYNAHGHLQFSGDATSGPLGNSNSAGTGHLRAKWISKTVTNNTADAWTSFELELQVLLGTPSGQGDGLSFADGSTAAGLFNSDVFSTYTRQDVTRDYLNFSGGTVAIGQSVTFNFAISDNAGNDPFYLLQTANKQDIPEPGALALLALALGGVGLTRRR